MAQGWNSPGRSGRVASQSLQQNWLGAHPPARHVDPLLLVSAAGLTCVGLVFVYSATFHRLEQAGDDPMAFLERQAIAFGVGLVAALAVSLFDYRVFQTWSVALYAMSVGLLVLVLLRGEVVNGARAWLNVGGLQFQPSELAKAALIVTLAALFHERREEALGLRALVEALAIAALPMVLILLQPDFGTLMVFVAIVCGVLLLARVRVRYMALLAAIGVVTIVGAFQFELVKDYQVARLTSFLNAEGADAQGAGWNVNQAQIAIGSGRVLGQGLFRGSQAELGYVPENHTDFIFTVIGEETGFLGSMVVLGLYAILLSRGLRIAAASRDTFGTLLAGGVVAVLAFQLFINVGMTVGLMPVTGLPLPFVSFGGTSLVACWIMVGLLQNVHMRRFR